MVCDRELWKVFNFGDVPLTADELRQRFKYINEKTKTVKVKGMVQSYPLNKWKNVTLTESMLFRLSTESPNLENLSISDAYLNCQRVS